MDNTSSVLFFVGLLLRVSVAVSAHSWDESDLSMASVVVKEGESAKISCMLKESNVAYFWLKGGSLENSTVVASFISGRPTNDPDEPFTVTENGTLIIKTVSRTDEGKYICRVSSKEISCHSEVFVFVQAALQDFQLTIAYCEPENSCVISTESTKPTSLTCKATNASPSMKLKWFNGSREIKDNIKENSLTKGTSNEISITLKDVYKAPSTLTCQAVDFKTSNDNGMFAHVQFRTPASTADISPGWMVTAILFVVGFVILFLFVIFITVRQKVRNGKGVYTQNSAERESLLSKDKEIKEKGEQILKLETDLRTKNDDIKTKSVEITKLNEALMETNADKRVNESNVTSKDTELKDKREQILKLETDLRTKGAEMKTMSEEIINLKDALMKTDADKRVNESNLTSKDKELQDKRQQILKLEKSLETVTGNLSNKNKEDETQKEKLIQKELQIQKLQGELEHVKEPLTKIQKREQEISSREKVMIGREAGVKKREQHLNSKESKLGEQETDVKKREWEVNQNKMELTAREAETKKQLLHLERKERRFRLDQMDVKDPIRINCRLITSRLGDDARVGNKDIGGQAKVTTKKHFWEINAKDARFHTIYPSSAKPQDICQSIVDLVEHALDGGNSCLIAYDNIRHEHWTTMLGKDEGASDALVPYATQTIFRKIKELAALDYQVDVKARFMNNSCMAKVTTSTPTFFENFKKFDIANEQTALDLVKIGHGIFQQVDMATGHLVQFFIKAESDKETFTGVLVLGTIGSSQMIKECFLSVQPTTQLTQKMSAIISDCRCRSVLITHIHEDKVKETNDCLALVNEIGKKPKK